MPKFKLDLALPVTPPKIHPSEALTCKPFLVEPLDPSGTFHNASCIVILVPHEKDYTAGRSRTVVYFTPEPARYDTLTWSTVATLDAYYRFVRYLEEGESFTYTE
jgi:hypothetical protein